MNYRSRVAVSTGSRNGLGRWPREPPAAGRVTTVRMSRSIVRTAHAPAAIGPYSQAVVVPVGGQRMVFCSGQIALDPATGALVEGDIGAQTRQVLDNLGAVLAAAGAGFANVVKTTIFL